MNRYKISILAGTVVALAALFFLRDSIFIKEKALSKQQEPAAIEKAQPALVEPAYSTAILEKRPDSVRRAPAPAFRRKISSVMSEASADSSDFAEVVSPPPPPAPVLEPSPEPKGIPEKPIELAHSRSGLDFSTQASFSRIDGSGTGSSVRLLSNLNLGMDIAWRQDWAEDFSTRIGFGFKRVDFQGAPNNKTIEQKNKTFGGLGAGASYRITDGLEAGLGAGTQQEIFYTPIGPGSIRVEQVAIPRLEASIRYGFKLPSGFRAGFGGRSAYLLSQKTDLYSVKSGSSHRLLFFLKEETNANLKPAAEIFYERKKQSTSQYRKNEKEMGLQLGFTWSFGP